jgi:hypothetical protein
MPRRRLASARGGRRPGAGAPKGNLNAIKTGRHSKQLLALTEVLLASPAMRSILFKMLEQKKRGDRTLQDASKEMARRIIRRSIMQNALPQVRKARVFRKQ